MSAANATVAYHCYFFFNAPATTEIYTLSLHDALPIFRRATEAVSDRRVRRAHRALCHRERSEEHTAELQSPYDLECRLRLEKKKKHCAYCSSRRTKKKTKKKTTKIKRG